MAANPGRPYGGCSGIVIAPAVHCWSPPSRLPSFLKAAMIRAGASRSSRVLCPKDLALSTQSSAPNFSAEPGSSADASAKTTPGKWPSHSVPPLRSSDEIGPLLNASASGTSI